MKANKRLTKAFKHAETIPFDKNSKFIFFYKTMEYYISTG